MARWSKIRQLLEQEYLAPVLRGRVRYFATRYRHAHDGGGRVTIQVDGHEVINMPFTTEYQRYGEAHARREGRAESLHTIYEAVEKDFAQEGKFEPGDFGQAVDILLHCGVADALCSENPLVRLLAILDRRAGKRTLLKQRDMLENQPEWLQYFYKLRLESEGIPIEE